MNVAVRRFQQSPMFGQAALSHTVWSFSVLHQLLQIAIIFADRRRGAQPRRPRRFGFNGNQHLLSFYAIRVSKTRDSSKFSARRKNPGAISNARRGTNPINWSIERRTQPRGFLANRGVDGDRAAFREIRQIHRNLRAISRCEMPAHRLHEREIRRRIRGSFAAMACATRDIARRQIDVERDQEIRALPSPPRPPSDAPRCRRHPADCRRIPGRRTRSSRRRFSIARRGFVKINGHTEAPPDLFARAMRRSLTQSSMVPRHREERTGITSAAPTRGCTP